MSTDTVSAAERPAEAPYPKHWEADVVLRDGGLAHLRPIRPSDADAVQELHVAQSPESVYLRFFAPLPRIPERELRRFTNVDYDDRVAFVITVGEKIIGIGRYDRTSRQEAEVAFNIADAHQGRGIGSVLLEHLAAAARERGIRHFVADVLPRNRKMVAVFKDAGYEVRHHMDDGVITLDFNIDPTEKSVAVIASREHRSEANSLAGLLQPRSVVVFGAGRTDGSLGSRLLTNLRTGCFTGRIHVIHPSMRSVQGIPAHRTVAEIGEEVDLAVVAIPAASVPGLIDDCVAAGVRGMVVVSAGFAEQGPVGARLQNELAAKARRAGLRIIGPTSLGIINTDAAFNLNASLATALPRAGNLGLFSQSGALGVAVLESAADRGLGLSSFVNAGNRADVSGNDLMQYWLEDPRTEVVGLYMESSGNPRKFSRIARRLAGAKPTIVVKSGTSGYGVPPGHEVRPTTAPKETFHEMLRQVGAIRVDSIHQLFDVAQLLCSQPTPSGPRVGIIDNSGAIGALIADEVEACDLIVAGAPVSVSPTATSAEVRKALRDLVSRPDVDSVVVCFMPMWGGGTQQLAEIVAQVAQDSPKTHVACFLGIREATHHGPRGSTRVPAYPAPEDAVRALASATHYATWCGRDHGTLVNPDGIDEAAGRNIVVEALDGIGGEDGEPARMPEHLAMFLLQTYGIEVAPTVRVASYADAEAAAERIGYPVILKYASRSARDRLSHFGYRLDIHTPGELRREHEELVEQATEDELEAGMLVQRMAPYGQSVTINSIEDPLFGPVLSFGLHGDPFDLLGDVAHRIPPLTTTDVSEMVRAVKASRRLFGYKGSPRLDVEALEDLIARVARLADDVPELARLSLKPIVVAQTGLMPLNARIWLSRPSPRTDSGPRRFRAGT